MAKTMDGTAFVTADEAAELLGTTAVQVLMLIRQKAVIGSLVEGEWLINADSVRQWLAAPAAKKQLKSCAGSCAGCNCS
ncbi:helix-turn-helix domain-containing protein [Geotalea sp. SG265]|uniref:helix-turn-helix domain-containing protein n=1 Tax=Geotalea sp. SG265 TaxID=2922867 RepID=UPI001FB007F9|nr:helix-turn-helix domain-containing protein [Geotalea sp. SG265]